MSKLFKRVSKKNRKSNSLNQELFKNYGDGSFDGAKIARGRTKVVSRKGPSSY